MAGPRLAKPWRRRQPGGTALAAGETVMQFATLQIMQITTRQIMPTTRAMTISGHDPHAWLNPRQCRGLAGCHRRRVSPPKTPKTPPPTMPTPTSAKAEIQQLQAEMRNPTGPGARQTLRRLSRCLRLFRRHIRPDELQAPSPWVMPPPPVPPASPPCAINCAQGGVVCVFPEANHDPKLLLQILEGSDRANGCRP